jgi:heptosyltransferase II
LGIKAVAGKHKSACQDIGGSLKKMNIEKCSVKNILIIRTSALGDIVCSFPALVSVAKYFPDAEISFMTGEQYIEFFEPCPYVKEIIPYKKRKNAEDLRGFINVIRDIRSRRFDLVLNFQNTKRFDLIGNLSGAAYKSSVVTLDRPTNGVEGAFRILETVGIDPQRRYYEFWYTAEDREYALAFLERHGLSEKDKLVGINPGGAWRSKQWPLEKYAELADKLTEATGARVVVFGLKDERNRAEQIAQRAERPLIVNSGESTIRQTALIISMCSLFVSNDSGLMHVASLQDVPTVAIFGSTNPAYHGPCREGNVVIYRGTDCSPCYEPECNLDIEKYFCLGAISADQVFREARRIMK